MRKTAFKMAKVSQEDLKRNVENSFHNGKGKPKRRKLAKKSRSQALRGMWKTAFKMAKVSLEDAKSRNTYIVTPRQGQGTAKCPSTQAVRQELNILNKEGQVGPL